MRPLKSGNLFVAAAAAAAAAAGGQIYRKRLLRSVPICDSSHRSLSTGGGFGMSRKPYLRKKRLPLPAELLASGNVAELTCESAARGGICHVYLIGTRHRTKKSNEEVKAMIEFVKPEVVFLELCPRRTYLLKPKRASEVGEFYVANKEAMKYGAKVVLGDRHYDITTGRFPIMAHFWERLIFPLSCSYIRVIEVVIKRYYEKDARGAYLLAQEELHRTIPSYYDTLINERDQYMSATLLEVARQHNSVVAVVGMGHLPGIQKYWKQPVDMKQLLHAPTRTRKVTQIRDVLLDRILYRSV